MAWEDVEESSGSESRTAAAEAAAKVAEAAEAMDEGRVRAAMSAIEEAQQNGDADQTEGWVI